MTDPEQVEALVAAVLETFGRIDILINDAAYNKWIPFDDLDAMTYEEWSHIIDVNLTGRMLCTKAVAPAMKKQGAGRIVNISSVAGLAPSGSSIPYAVSKAGLIHLTRCMAVGLAPDILVNCIAPGYLEGTRATANLDPAYRGEGPDRRPTSASGRQGRHRPPSRRVLPDRQHHRPDAGHGLRPVLSLTNYLARNSPQKARERFPCLIPS